MVRFLEILLKEFRMKRSLLAVVAAGIGILAIVSVLLIIPQESNVAEVEDTLNREILPVDIPEIQEKLDEIQKIVDENNYTPVPREWQSSGPFSIDRKEYAIGEKIFLRIGGLDIGSKGEVAVYRPLNSTHSKVYITIPFDETDKGGFNFYVQPLLSKTRGICSVDDIMGKWTLAFRGTNYPNLDFEIIDSVVPGTEIETVC